MNISIINNCVEERSLMNDIVIAYKQPEQAKISVAQFDFEEDNLKSIALQFVLSEDDDDLEEFNFYHHKNSSLLFFRRTDQWGIINLEQQIIKRHIYSRCIDFPFFYFHNNCYLVVDDLFAETISLNGDLVDEIGNEQPHEVMEFDDYFEFDIIGVEKRKLYKGNR